MTETLQLLKSIWRGKYGVGYEIYKSGPDYQMRVFKGSRDREIDRRTFTDTTLDAVTRSGDSDLDYLEMEIEHEGDRCG